MNLMNRTYQAFVRVRILHIPELRFLVAIDDRVAAEPDTVIRPFAPVTVKIIGDGAPVPSVLIQTEDIRVGKGLMPR